MTLNTFAFAPLLWGLSLGLPDEPTEADWPQWRGPRRDAISAEPGLLAEWPEGGPEVLWRIEVGDGYSGIAVVGACLAAGRGDADLGAWLGCLAVAMATVNVVGGFLVTERMLRMFKGRSDS